MKELLNKYFSSRRSRFTRKSGKVEGIRCWIGFKACTGFRKAGVDILKSGKTGPKARESNRVVPIVHMGSAKPCGNRCCRGGKRVTSSAGSGR